MQLSIKKEQKNFNKKIEYIPTNKIDPSPFQKRKYFDEIKLKDLAASVENDGLIEPIIVRPKNKRYELIAGERRLRAIIKYTNITNIQSKIIVVNDLQARRISAAENLQREDFAALETIEAIIEIVDAELIENKEYSSFDSTPTGRVKYLLSKLHSIKVSKNKGSKVNENRMLGFSKFAKLVENIFKKLPKRLEWITFYTHDMFLITNICEKI